MMRTKPSFARLWGYGRLLILAIIATILFVGKGSSAPTSNSAAHELFLPLVSKSPIDLKASITKTTGTLPQSLNYQPSSFCTWESECLMTPRLYHEPLAGGNTLLGWTDLDINDFSQDGHVSMIAGNSITWTVDFANLSVRGLTAHADGSFALLLWDSEADIMYLSRRDPSGDEVWTTNLNSPIAVADFWVGGGRLAYGGGLYAAYFTVRGVAGQYLGHHGDQLTYVDDDGGIQTGGWNWGCSHSMAQLISYHPGLDQFAPICSSDCYTKKGILLNNNQLVYAGDGDCAGLVSTQLGQAALADGSWKVVFNAVDRPCCEGKGVALATVNASYQSSYIWLTDSDGTYESDPSIALLGTDVQADRYLVGWTTSNDDIYWLAIIDGNGTFLAAPEEVTSMGVKWGVRDDSFRTRPDGSVSWVYGDALADEIYLFRFTDPLANNP
jgi:hypothetical protein